MMAINENSPAGSGEARLKARRNKFWTFVFAALVVAAIAGFASGFLVALIEDGSVPGLAVIPILVITVSGFVWFSYRYYKKVDELDLADNLWANTFGIYFFIITPAGWQMLHDAGLTGPPHLWTIWIGGILVAGIAYGIRKLNFR